MTTIVPDVKGSAARSKRSRTGVVTEPLQKFDNLLPFHKVLNFPMPTLRPLAEIRVVQEEARPVPRYISARTAAEALDTSESLVRRLIADGRLRAFRMDTGRKPGLIRIRVEDFEAFIERELRPLADEDGVVEIEVEATA